LAAKAAGFDAVDVKLIFGIPGQDKATFLAAVRECLTMGVDQISA
jgi:coproporphyrinogen III oxidase-like Fe-S oxidoreductase